MSCDIEKTDEESFLTLKNTEDGRSVVESKSYWFRCHTHSRIIKSSTEDLEKCMFLDRKSTSNTNKDAKR